MGAFEENTKLHEVYLAARSYRHFLSKAVDVGPLTKAPSREAALLRRLYAAIDAVDAEFAEK